MRTVLITLSVIFHSSSIRIRQITVEKEALALIWALQHFEVYSCGTMPAVVYMEHNPLTFLHLLQNPNRHLVSWSLFLQPLEIHHVKGIDSVLADALSCAPCGGE